MTTQEQMYSWDFVREIAGWSKAVTFAVALCGILFAHDIRFAVTCALAAFIDIVILLAIEQRGREKYEGHDSAASITYGTLAWLIGLRLLLKGVLLGLASAFPGLFSFWGMVAGVLVVDSTVVLIGGPMATLRTFRAGRDA